MSTKSGATSTKLSVEVKVLPGPPKSSFDFVSLLPTGLTIAAAVIGYVIVEKFARKREARSDLRSLLDSFRGTLDLILADATAFYSEAGATPRARALAAVIRSKIGFLPDILEAMSDAGIELHADPELILVRKTITGGQFDSMARAALPANDGKFVEIASVIEQLRRRVELSFYNSLVKGPVVKKAKQPSGKILRYGQRDWG